MEAFQENVIEFLKYDDKACVTFTKGKYIRRIKELAKKFPDEVKIIKEYNDGTITANIPVNYIHINHTKRELTEEQKIELQQRINKAREAKNS